MNGRRCLEEQVDDEEDGTRLSQNSGEEKTRSELGIQWPAVHGHPTLWI